MYTLRRCYPQKHTYSSTQGTSLLILFDKYIFHFPLKFNNFVSIYLLVVLRRTPRGPSLLTHTGMYSDGKPRRNMEAIPKKKNLKTKPSTHYAESTIPHQGSERHLYKMHPSHAVEYEDWGRVCDNPIFDSSSDCSSIFSASDAGSYSTDSTKDSNAEDISGYIFGSSLHHT